MALLSGGSPPPSTKYLFVDGGYLRECRAHIAKEILRTDSIPIDLKKLTHNFDRVFYYDCLPGRKARESHTEYEARIQDSRAWLNQVASHDRIHVVEGVVASVGGRARQKKTDVQIAVDALMHAFNRNFGTATLLTGDQDFAPLVQALVGLGIEVTVWCHQRSASRDLVRAADVRRSLDSRVLVSMSPEAFRRTFDFPEISGESQRGDGEQLDTGRGPDGEEVALLRLGDSLAIVHPDPQNWSHWMRTSFPEEGLLRRVHEDVFFPTKWEQAAT